MGREEESREAASGAGRKEGPGDRGQTLGPPEAEDGHLGGGRPPHPQGKHETKAGLPPGPNLSPSTGSPTTKAHNRSQQVFSEALLCAGALAEVCVHLGSSCSFLPSPGLCPLTPGTLVHGQAFTDSLVSSY